MGALVGGGKVVVGVGGSFRSGREEYTAAVMAALDAAEQAAMMANVVFDMVASRGLCHDGLRGSLVLIDGVARRGWCCQLRVSAVAKGVRTIGPYASTANARISF